MTIQASPFLACLSVTGVDATTFLQGQLTQDMVALSQQAVGTRAYAAFCSPKGRMLASFEVQRIENVDTAPAFAFYLAEDLAETIAKRLSMFVMRAKVKVERINSENANPQSKNDWLLGQIRAGVAHITAATTDQFVPQMVNFELIGGVNFRKGCYPGQEIVARSQYLGKLRRRAHRASVTLPNETFLLALADVFLLADIENQRLHNPVGRIIQAAMVENASSDNTQSVASQTWECLFEYAQHSDPTHPAPVLCLQNGEILHSLQLPYVFIDITA